MPARVVSAPKPLCLTGRQSIGVSAGGVSISTPPVTHTVRPTCSSPKGLSSKGPLYHMEAKGMRTTSESQIVKTAIDSARRHAGHRVEFQPHGEGDMTVRYKFERHGGWPVTKLVLENRMYLGAPGELFKIVRDRHNDGDKLM